MSKGENPRSKRSQHFSSNVLRDERMLNECDDLVENVGAVENRSETGDGKLVFLPSLRSDDLPMVESDSIRKRKPKVAKSLYCEEMHKDVVVSAENDHSVRRDINVSSVKEKDGSKMAECMAAEKDDLDNYGGKVTGESYSSVHAGDTSRKKTPRRKDFSSKGNESDGNESYDSYFDVSEENMTVKECVAVSETEKQEDDGSVQHKKAPRRLYSPNLEEVQEWDMGKELSDRKMKGKVSEVSESYREKKERGKGEMHVKESDFETMVAPAAPLNRERDRKSVV